jgi:hypothetical protein
MRSARGCARGCARGWWWSLIGTVLLGSGCLDSVVRSLGPDNNPQVTNTPEKFEFVATDLRNVNDRITWVWPNPAPKAALRHDSFIHHGYGILVIHDAAGVLVDSTLLELNLDTETAVGTPGNWTLTLTLAAARGRADITLTPEQ